jgi:DNA-binding response OmpR family regulator
MRFSPASCRVPAGAFHTAGDGGKRGADAVRALVIEDDARMSRILSLELRRAGWEVTAETTGRLGLARAVADPHDAVILDLSLPDLDGLAVCRALREASDVPIVILTARGDVEDRVHGLDAGADDYLVKPFAPAELLARLRAVVRRGGSRRPRPDQPLQAGDLTLDRARREVRRAGQPVELTRREFDLLAYFLENAGIVLTRDMILERVWGWGFTGGSNIVDVYVGYLRAKVEGEGRPPLLHTVRGVGYVLRPPAQPDAT